MYPIESYDFTYSDFLIRHSGVEEILSMYEGRLNSLYEDLKVVSSKGFDPSRPVVQSSPRSFDDRIINISNEIDILEKELNYFKDKLNGFERHFKESLVSYKQIEAIVIREYFRGGDGRTNMRNICALAHKSMATVKGIIDKYVEENRDYHVPGLNRANYTNPVPDDYIWNRSTIGDN